MIINSDLDEVKKSENALSFIKDVVINNGRNNLFDLTGLSGGFIASNTELNLLETYTGPAMIEEDIQKYGLEHLAGQKVLPVNRTSSGILATILALVNENSVVVHFLAKSPAHPSIIRSCNLVNASYFEFDEFDAFYIPNNTSLVIITGSTMDHQVIDEVIFRKIITLAHKKNIPVFVDDASGARVRTILYNQPKAIDLGANLVITSTDKLMSGPRGGLIAGDEDLIDSIKVKVNQFGLEAQAPICLAMVNALKEFSSEDLKKGFLRKDQLFNLLNKRFSMFEKSSTSIMITEDNLKKTLAIETDLSSKDLAFAFSMILLKDFGIITIPAVSMPGASTTIRFDLSTKDAFRLDLNDLFIMISKALSKLYSIANNEKEIRNFIFK